MKELNYAICCGNCIHSSRPKNPDDHAPHYYVAKTERWCYLNHCFITRELCCESYDPDIKKGGIPAAKRVLAFNKKLDLLRIFEEKLNGRKISYFKNDREFKFWILNAKVYKQWPDGVTVCYGPKDKETSEYLKIIQDNM